MATIVREPRMEQFRAEQRKKTDIERCSGYSVHERLKRDREDKKCVLAVAALVTILMMCGLGATTAARDKTKALEVEIEESDSPGGVLMLDQGSGEDGSGREEEIRQWERMIACVHMLHSAGCMVELCEDGGKMNCLWGNVGTEPRRY